MLRTERGTAATASLEQKSATGSKRVPPTDANVRDGKVDWHGDDVIQICGFMIYHRSNRLARCFPFCTSGTVRCDHPFLLFCRGCHCGQSLHLVVHAACLAFQVRALTV